MMDELKMMMCRAIVQAANDRGEYDTPSKEWSKDDFEIHNVWKDVAAAIRAIEEAGYVVVKNDPLPCDVKLPHATTISSGCALSTLLAGLEVRRNGFPEVSAEQVATIQHLLKSEFRNGDWETVESEADALNLEEPRG